MNEELMKMITSLVEGDKKNAEDAFSAYLKEKTRSMLEASFAHDMDSDEFEEEMDHNDMDDSHMEEEEIEDINRQVEEYRKRLMKDQQSSSRRPMRRHRDNRPASSTFGVRMNEDVDSTETI